MARVSGVIHTETGGPALNATVRAFDKDLRHEQLLGEAVVTETSGRYEIPYTADKFRRSEKKTADLIVRSYWEGNQRAESEIRFNAGDDERIDLTFEPLPVVETSRLSELERLQDSIETVREGVAYRDFTDQDLRFLTEETIRSGPLGVSERRTIRQRLEFLRLADRYALRTGIPLAAFYGWFRQDQPQILEALLDVPARTLRAALAAAIHGNIIPDITAQLADILERVGTSRIEQGRVVNHRFVVQLINAADSHPLAGYSVAVIDQAAEPEDQPLGTLLTDGRGACVIVFSLPGDAPANVTRRLRLVISDEGIELATATVEARANQEEVATLRVRLRENASGDAAIADSAPPALAARLHERGIATLHDVLAHPEVIDEDDPESLERLRATAKFAILAPSIGPAARDDLLDRGYRSVLDVGSTSRAAFYRDREGSADADTYVTLVASRTTGKMLHHMIGSAWLKNETAPDDEPEDPDIPTGVNDTLDAFRRCGCKDCDSAVSPAAYLAHLLEWTLQHIKDGAASISFSQMEEEFHQPFGDLPASCAAVDEHVRQVRISIETLWRFTEFLDRTDLQLPTPFRTAYRHLRNQLYRGILTHLGTSFEQLRIATLQVQGDDLTAERVAAQRRTIADLLGIDETHLDALFFNVEQPPISPSEDELQQRFGFKSTRTEDVFASMGTPDLVTWQRERLESIWQGQDWPADAYSGEARRPFIDPALIDASYLRIPLEENAAAALLEARRAALASHRQSLVDQQPQQNGLADLLENELGQSIDQLRSLYTTLQMGEEPQAIVQAHETIAALHLTPGGFTQLMTVDERFEAGEPIGLTTEALDAAWEAVFEILSRAHRHGLFPEWVEEENDLGLVFGPKLFWLPVEPPPAANAWQATAIERDAWRNALNQRSARPLIDPDQIPENYVIVILVFIGAAITEGNNLALTSPQPPLTTFALWQQRRAWIDGRLEALRGARQDQPSLSAILEAALSASTIGVGSDAFAELANMEAAGIELGPRLAQLNLTTTEYRFIAGIRELVQGNASIANEMWQQLDAILVAAEKRREFAEWRLAEQSAEITLHPHRFVVQDDPAPEDDSPQARWMHDPIALQRWTAALEARADQLRALRDGLDRAVSNAEEAVLPLLRNILIMQTAAASDSLLEKAEWLDKRLLIGMRVSGCQMTTRVSQAIETLQRFIRGVYTQEHPPLMEHLTLDAEEDYEAEWPVLGSYATWRAFMLAYLFPENLLHLSPPSRLSFGFARLKDKLPSRITPPQACAAAEEYSSYFHDVFHLDIQASCQVRTRLYREEGCGATASAYRSRVHVFAIAAASGKAYANSFDSYSDSKDTLDTWQPVPKLSDVLEIIGAVPHETPTQQRLILLFVKVREVAKTRLQFVAFDLDTNSWSKAKPRELDLPPGAESDFSAVAAQKRHGSAGETLTFVPTVASSGANAVPTILVIRVPDGRVYVRNLNTQASDWAGSDWIPLFGDLRAREYKRVCALVQRSRDEYLMILQQNDGALYYRIFSVEPVISKDDGFWRSIAIGDFAGAFIWPGTADVFVFYRTGGSTKYKIIGETLALTADGYASDSIVALDAWLRTVAGVTLESYSLDFSTTAVLGDWPVQETEGANCHYVDREVNVRYVGNLYDVLTLTEESWEWTLPELNLAEESCLTRDGKSVQEAISDYRTPILESLQEIGRQKFELTVERSSRASFEDRDLGPWKLADWYVRQFAESVFEGVEVSLAAAVTNASFGSSANPFRYRGFATETQAVGTGAMQPWRFVEAIVSSGGDEEFGNNPGKAIALEMPNGEFRLRLQRSGEVLSAPRLSRLAPEGEGPFDLTPMAAKEDLQLRREEIRMMYQAVGEQASLRIYLKEAYNLIPTFLGYELQRSSYYEEALIWYRQVYDYLHSKDKRKIDYGLKLEQALGLSYEDAEEWFDAANNTHAIAATRKNTYTRHILLMIIRCLIDYANSLFARDNVTDNARARELYTTALTLLSLGELKHGSSPCPNIIGQLEIDVVEPGTLPLQQFKLAMAHIPDPGRLGSLVTALRAINQDTSRPTIDRLTDMRDSVLSAVNEVPPAPRMSTALATKRQTVATLENQFLADQPSRMLLAKTHQRARQAALTNLAQVADRTEDVLLDAATALPWLRHARPEERPDVPDESLNLALFNASESRRLAVLNEIKSAAPMASLLATQGSSFGISAGISFDFCIPQNPIIQSLRARAENNLGKLRTCRNIAGFLRQIDPYGAPIGIGSGMVSPDGSIFSGVVDAPPTPYRYITLINRAKELVGISQQVEAGYQAALENAERVALNLMQAQQSVELAGARVSLQDLRVTQANNELGLAQLQKSSAVLREGTYADWIAAGKNEHEQQMLQSYSDAAEAQQQAARAGAAASVAQMSAAMLDTWSLKNLDQMVTGVAAAKTVALGASIASTLAQATFQERALTAEANAQAASFEASFERNNDQWLLEQGLAALDVQIGDQQIALATNQIAIVEQERIIAGLEHTQAIDILNFLLGNTFTEEMYRWIASVLEEVYRFFLQEATVIARLAQQQLAFELPQAPLKIVQADYWSVAVAQSGSGDAADNMDRRGLTGSARLLKDIYQLDNYAFESRQRKQALTLTLDLAAMFPLEFQRFRETGVLIFSTPQSLIDRQLPGYYLCLIQQVSVSIVALIPPTYGIRATLTSAGISRAVVGGDTFQTVTIRNLPERMALTSATTTSGAISLQPDGQALLHPFEGSGFDTLWELRMAKASNPFDYNSMATVLFTVNMTALHSFDYEREVVQQFDRKVSFDRAFDFRQVFSDPWYDLNNPDQTETSMVVRFNTHRSDFPPNLSNLAIQHVVLYLVRKDGEMFEQPIRHLYFTAEGMNGSAGGSASTVNGRVSTRSGNGTNWLPLIGQAPYGEWELAFPDNPPVDAEVRNRFANKSIENILLVMSVSGQTPAFPY